MYELIPICVPLDNVKFMYTEKKTIPMDLSNWTVLVYEK
jgi:hypothetical protein